MPSPTESTEPISLTVASVPKLAIWSLMTLLISAARISIIQPFIGGIWAYGLSALHRLRETIETGTDAAVDQLAAQLVDEAAENGGIKGPPHGAVAPDPGVEVRGRPLVLRGGERGRPRKSGG